MIGGNSMLPGEEEDGDIFRKFFIQAFFDFPNIIDTALDDTFCLNQFFLHRIFIIRQARNCPFKFKLGRIQAP